MSIDDPDAERVDPASRAGSAEHAYERLRQRILSGEISPGTAFSQVQLASELGISRTPLREAVRRLQSEGLLRSERNRRVRVSPLSTGDLEDLYAIRIGLDSLATHMTVPRLTGAEMGRLRSLHAAQKRALLADDLAAYHEPHRLFHHALYQHAGPRHLAQVRDLWDHAERYRLLYLGHAGDRAHLVHLAGADHDAILAAARARDADGCARLVAEHLARTALMTIVRVDHRHEPTRVRAALALVGTGVAVGAGLPRAPGAPEPSGAVASDLVAAGSGPGRSRPVYRSGSVPASEGSAA